MFFVINTSYENYYNNIAENPCSLALIHRMKPTTATATYRSVPQYWTKKKHARNEIDIKYISVLLIFRKNREKKKRTKENIFGKINVHFFKK